MDIKPNGHTHPQTLPSLPPESMPVHGNGSPQSPAKMWYGLDLNWHPKLEIARAKIVRWYNQGSTQTTGTGGALILMGDPGCGKTHLANVVYELYGGNGHTINWSQDEQGNNLAETVRNAVLYTEPDLFSDIRQSYGGKGLNEVQIIGSCKAAKLLILDDIGVAYIKEESAAWAYDLYWRIFDARVKKFTLITTNLTMQLLAARIGGRALSRLMEMMGGDEAIVDLFGVPDYRQRGW